MPNRERKPLAEINRVYTIPFYLLAPFISVATMFLLDVIESLIRGGSIAEGTDPTVPPILDVAWCFIAPIALISMGMIQIPFMIILERLNQHTFLRVLVLGTMLGVVVNLCPSYVLYAPEVDEFWTTYLFVFVVCTAPFIIGVVVSWLVAFAYGHLTQNEKSSR